jgi:hypothetical protein
VQCTSITKLPTSISHLSSLHELGMQGCGGLQSLPDSLKEWNVLWGLTMMDCRSLEDLGALRMLQGVEIWRCTSITKLSGSCLMVVDSNFWDFAWFYDLHCNESKPLIQNLKELLLVKTNDCGFFHHIQDNPRLILQHFYKSPCCKSRTRITNLITIRLVIS